MAVMNKTLIIHHINDIDNIPAMERWFVHHHCPEVMAQEHADTLRYVPCNAAGKRHGNHGILQLPCT